MLTRQRQALTTILGLIVEADTWPSENTHDRLVERSGLPETTVVWALDVLWNQGKGVLEAVDHPRAALRGFHPKDTFVPGSEDLDALVARWLKDRKPTADEGGGLITFDHDPDDPDDVWQPGVYEEDDD